MVLGQTDWRYVVSASIHNAHLLLACAVQAPGHEYGPLNGVTCAIFSYQGHVSIETCPDRCFDSLH